MFSSLEKLSPDPLFRLLEQFQADQNPNKLNLGIGVYATEQGEPYVLPVVQQAAREVSVANFNYLPIGGDPLFLKQTARIVFGDMTDQSSFVSQATCGGTHACALFAELARRGEIKKMIIAEPTWVNHRHIFSGFEQTSISHLDQEGNPNIDGYRTAIDQVTEPTVLLLHGGPTHNPTGRNLTKEQINLLIQLIQSKPIFVFIDFAYLGLGDGFEQDAISVRALWSQLENVAVGVSFSKNATLYCHRTGALFVKTADGATVESNLRRIMRTTISNPPAYGEKILVNVFENHFDQWKGEVDAMRQSVERRRKELVSRIPTLGYLSDTRGLFGMLRITQEQIDTLKADYSIYIPEAGRINLSGIRLDRMDYLVKAINSIIT